MNNFRTYYGFTSEPFLLQINTDQLYPTKALNSSYDRLLYAIKLKAIAIITGEVGSGKSTTLRYAADKLHPSQYQIIPVIASPGSILEILRLVGIELNLDVKTHSTALITKAIKSILVEIIQRKQNPILIIDEAHLMRLEVFTYLHTLGQIQINTKLMLPIILSGQNSLIDKLLYHTSKPIASRVVAKTHLEGLKLIDMTGYLKHHLEIAGLADQLFSDEAILAIHQGSGGLLRRANILARGALIAAANEKCQMVAAEHVRIASTEII